MQHGYYSTPTELELARYIYSAHVPTVALVAYTDVKDVLKEVYSTNEKLVLAVKSKADPAGPTHILKMMKLSSDLGMRAVNRVALSTELKFHMYVNKDNNKYIAKAKGVFFQFHNHFAMEIESFPLGDLSNFAGRNALPVMSKMRIMHGAARGVAYLHSIHIVHSDIKMRNIVVVKTNTGALTAKLIDFGSAKVCGRMITPGTKWGDTMVWRGPDLWPVAPTQTGMITVPQEVPIRGSADVWSLGCVAIALVNNQTRPPWMLAKVREDIDYQQFLLLNPGILDKNVYGINPPPLVFRRPEFGRLNPCFVNELIFNMLRVDPKLRINAENVATRLQLWTQASS